MKKQLLSISSILMVGAVLVLQSCSKEDTTAPVVTITGGSSVITTLNETYTLPEATATDEEDGEITTITKTGTVNKDLAGVYTVVYSATDAAGNEGTATLTVTVRNDAYEWEGSYTGTEVDVLGPYTYVGGDNVVTADSLVNDKIWITRLGDFKNNTVYMMVTGTSISIPVQTVANVGTGTADCDVHSRKTSGTGVLVGSNVISLTYDDEKVAPCDGARVGVEATFTKK